MIHVLQKCARSLSTDCAVCIGYCGRFLALHIHQNKLASDVRLVDKMLPELAWLAPEFSDACSRDKFVQADASREREYFAPINHYETDTFLSHAEALSRVFNRADGKEFDYVFNLGGETRYSHEDEVYKARSHSLSLALGREAARRKAKVYVEASTGMVYKPEKQKKRAETDKTKPWIKKAKWKLQAEEDLQKIPGLNLMIMRLAHVYGPYTTKLVGTALCMARVYQSLNKEMKWLWDKNLRTNTVHVEDIARALWCGAEWYVKEPRKGVPIFNVVDDGDTCAYLLSLGIFPELTERFSPRYDGSVNPREFPDSYRLSRHAHLSFCTTEP